jgi:hypothetical protein
MARSLAQQDGEAPTGNERNATTEEDDTAAETPLPSCAKAPKGSKPGIDCRAALPLCSNSPEGAEPGVDCRLAPKKKASLA